MTTLVGPKAEAQAIVPMPAGIQGAAETTAALALAASMALGAASADALWLTFFPPRAFQRWLGSRAPAIAPA